MRNLKESDIEKPACVYAEKRGWWVKKLKWVATNDAPDRIFAREGRVIFIEFKAQGKPAREAQLLEHDEMRAAGMEVYVVDTLARAYELLV